MKTKRPQTSLPFATVHRSKDPRNKRASIWRATTAGGLVLGEVRVRAVPLAYVLTDARGKTGTFDHTRAGLNQAKAHLQRLTSDPGVIAAAERQQREEEERARKRSDQWEEAEASMEAFAQRAEGLRVELDGMRFKGVIYSAEISNSSLVVGIHVGANGGRAPAFSNGVVDGHLVAEVTLSLDFARNGLERLLSEKIKWTQRGQFSGDAKDAALFRDVFPAIENVIERLTPPA